MIGVHVQLTTDKFAISSNVFLLLWVRYHAASNILLM